MSRRLCTFVYASLALCAATLGAQKIDCRATFSEWSQERDRAARLVRVKAAAARAGFVHSKTIRFSGFDARYGVSTIAVTSERRAVQADDADDRHEQFDVRMLFTVARPNGTTDYYRLGDAKQRLLSLVRIHDDDELPADAKATLAVTKKEPILRFTIAESSQGANSSFSTTWTYVADFSQTPPRFGAIECEDGSQGGFHAIDNSYAPKTSGGCQWSAAARDFVCTAITASNSGVSRRAQKRFTVLSHETLPPIVEQLAVFGSLETAAASLTEKARASFVVDGVGALEKVNVAGTTELFVAQADKETPALRFFTLDRKARALNEIEVAEIEDGVDRVNPDDDPDSSTYEPVGGWSVSDKGATLLPATHTLKTRPLFSGAAGSVIEIAELRDEASIYWLALPREGSPSALRITTTGEEYIAQNVTLRPASASSYSVEKNANAFRATVVVEPRTWIGAGNDDEQTSVADCSSTFVVTWNDGTFTTSPLKKCSAPRRLATISETGELGSADR